jgi:hypothetical protein
MKVIIAGSRTINSFELVESYILKLIMAFNLEITEVVCGGASGVDNLGKRWAAKNNVPVKYFPAEWNNLNAPGAVIKMNSMMVRYNVKAGFDRNERMAQYADALVLIWDGKSPGSKDMKACATKHNLKIFEVVV